MLGNIDRCKPFRWFIIQINFEKKLSLSLVNNGNLLDVYVKPVAGVAVAVVVVVGSQCGVVGVGVEVPHGE